MNVFVIRVEGRSADQRVIVKCGAVGKKTRYILSEPSAEKSVFERIKAAVAEAEALLESA